VYLFGNSVWKQGRRQNEQMNERMKENVNKKNTILE
jgi:hypothetical protein